MKQLIIDSLQNSGLYEGLHDGMAQAFAFIRKHRASPPPAGRYAIDGDDVYALVQSYVPQPAAQQIWESHREYFDVQYVASGAEAMGWAPMGSLTPAGEYLAEKDATFYRDGSATMLPCPAGTFTVFFPDDLHKPCCALDETSPVVKIVVKIRMVRL